jgi:hypothetical protein
MKNTTKLALVAGTVLTLGLAGTVVNAHPEGWGGAAGYGMGPGMGMGHGYGMGPGDHMGWGHGMGPGMGHGYGMGFGGLMHGPASAVGERLEDMKSALGITSEQQSAWQGFADSVRKEAANRQEWFERMHESSSPRTAPDWYAERAATMKQHAADLESVGAALKNLYGALTPEQRSTLDQGSLAARPRYGRRAR